MDRLNLLREKLYAAIDKDDKEEIYKASCKLDEEIIKLMKHKHGLRGQKNVEGSSE